MSLRVLTISKPYVAETYRDKLALLDAEADLTVGLICPTSWAGQAFENDETRFWTRRLEIVFDGRNHFHLYRGLDRAVAAFEPDVVNVEEEHYSAVTLQAFRSARAVGARCMFYTWQNIEKRYPPPFRFIERYVFRHASFGVAGNVEASHILRHKGFRGPVAVIPQMGVDIGRFEPSDLTRANAKESAGLDPSAFWLGYVGRVVEEKGIQDLITAMSAIDAAADVRLVVVGAGPYASHLQEMARMLRPGQVVFTGATPSAHVPDLLRAVDVVCLPSRTRANWKEQFGRVLVEAMAAEAVVLASDAGEIPNVVADAGIIHREGDTGQIALAISQLHADPALRATLRERARLRVRERYTNVVVANAFADAFRQAATG
jgi:glycosyltransferase involved in cell wall biosynthesis